MNLQEFVSPGAGNRRWPKPGGVLLAAMVVGVVAMLILPLPTALLDVLITCNIALSLLVLLVSLRIPGAARFSALPSLLLLTTLFRLGLNVSSTRLILLQADAGQVIASFGGFVVGGSLVVGVVIFLILTVIQYVVIARGSERVAEVAARFTLDALPGKQLAIDADVRAGLLDRAAAGRRRADLERECQVYGAMDGAMKFVRGDAIAAILIILIDIVGGLLIGVVSRGMDLQTAAQVYAQLTVGDGLVSQIPALLISLSAGMVVTRVASEQGELHLGEQLGRQLLGHPRSLGLTGAVLILLALIPGLPALPFALLGAGCLAVAGLAIWRRPEETSAPEQAHASWTRQPPPVVQLELGLDLHPCANPATRQGRQLRHLLSWTERLLWEELGLPMPRVEVVQARSDLGRHGFRVLLRGVPTGQGILPSGQVVALAPRATLEGAGVQPHEEATLPGVVPPAWLVPESAAAALRATGLELLEGPALLALHLTDAVRRHAPELIGVQETQDLLDILGQSRPALVQEVIPGRLSLPGLSLLLGELVGEEVSIRDLGQVLEAVAALPGEAPCSPELTELVRMHMGRAISTRLAASDGTLRALRLDPALEEVLADEADPDGELGAELARDLLNAVQQALPPADLDRPPVLLTHPASRRTLRRILQPHLPRMPVLSYRELSPELKVQTVGHVNLV